MPIHLFVLPQQRGECVFQCSEKTLQHAHLQTTNKHLHSTFSKSADLTVQSKDCDHQEEEECPDLFQWQVAGHLRVSQEGKSNARLHNFGNRFAGHMRHEAEDGEDGKTGKDGGHPVDEAHHNRIPAMK